MATDRTAACSAWEESYKRARDLIEKLSDADLDRPTANPGWTVRNLAAHIATSDAFLAVCAKPLSQGKSPFPLPVPNWLARKLGDMDNAKKVKQYREARPSELTATFDEIHAKASAALDAVAADGWDRPGKVPGIGKLDLAQFVEAFAEHTDDHSATLQKALG